MQQVVLPELHWRREPEEGAVDEVLARRQTLIDAVILCIGVPGIVDKSLFIDLEIDPPVLSRIRGGTANFLPDKTQALMDLYSNETPLCLWAELREVAIANNARMKAIRGQG